MPPMHSFAFLSVKKTFGLLSLNFSQNVIKKNFRYIKFIVLNGKHDKEMGNT